MSEKKNRTTWDAHGTSRNKSGLMGRKCQITNWLSAFNKNFFQREKGIVASTKGFILVFSFMHTSTKNTY